MRADAITAPRLPIATGEPSPSNGNTGPIADGGPALDKARATLLDSQISLVGVSETQIFGTKRLLQVYIDAKRAANELQVAASDPRLGFSSEFASSADLAKKAASMIGQTIKALGKVDGEFTQADRDLATKRLKAAHEVLGQATIGAFSGTHA